MNDCVPCVSGGEKRVEVRPSTPRLIGEFLAVDVGQIVIAPALALVRTERWARVEALAAILAGLLGWATPTETAFKG